MKRSAVLLTVLSLVLAHPAAGLAASAVGKPAPDFSAVDWNSQTRSLKEFRGKFVVLEWFNPDCPFVRKHYGTGNMQALQQTWTEKGVVWLSVNSSAPGKQGHVIPQQAKAFVEQRGAAPTTVLLDPAGALGRLYGAKTTPHLFVVNPEGVLVYAGAIDDTPSADPDDVPAAMNYVQRALEEAMAGEPVSVASTQPYGCSVKY